MIILIGILFRFYQITQDKFFFYDEGLYLEHNIDFLLHVDQKPPDSLSKLFRYLEVAFHVAISDGKALWFFISTLRVYCGGAKAWYFIRVVSAIFGMLSIFLIYRFTAKYSQSRLTGILAAVLLAVFPSQVFYSRLGLQESFSTFCFLLGFYFYFFPRKFQWQTFLSGFVFSLVYFTNYRLIILPALVAFAELFVSFAEHQKPNYRKWVWSSLTFLFIVFMVGAIDHGANTTIVFAWIFYQTHLARGQFELFDLFSYPYYLFRLESILFGLFFFGNIYFVVRKDYRNLFPFALVVFQMFLFSFSLEKGVRYMCVVMPFMVIAVTLLISELWKAAFTRGRKLIIGGAVSLLIICHLVKSFQIVNFRNDYEYSIRDILMRDIHAKVMSTQNMLQKLYVPNRDSVSAIPREVRFLYAMMAGGFRYLIIDPQAYVSLTQDDERFSLRLKGYLGFVHENVRPIKVYPHLSSAMLERFVFEHNQHLKRSLDFLRENKNDELGGLYLYDVQNIIVTMHQKRDLDPSIDRQIMGIEKLIKKAQQP